MSTWQDTAKLMFNQTAKEDFVKQRGLYDQLIIDCAFKESLQRKNEPSTGGCDGFEPTITTNGMCYTFNGHHSNDLWKASKMTSTFSNLFPKVDLIHKTFGGSRTSRGNQMEL